MDNRTKTEDPAQIIGRRWLEARAQEETAWAAVKAACDARPNITFEEENVFWKPAMDQQSAAWELGTALLEVKATSQLGLCMQAHFVADRVAVTGNEYEERIARQIASTLAHLINAEELVTQPAIHLKLSGQQTDGGHPAA